MVTVSVTIVIAQKYTAKMEKSTIQTVKLWGLPLFSGQESQLLDWLRLLALGKEKWPGGTLLVGTPNPEQVVLSRNNEFFRSFLGKLDILLPDGVGLVAASRLLGLRWGFAPLRQRITGVDVAKGLVDSAIQSPRFVVMVVGGRDLHSPKWEWVEGYRDVSNPTEGETNTIHEAITEVKPDVVCVAFGAPFQERWLLENEAVLKKEGVKVAIAVGGAFDMLSGRINRAPRFLRNLGLEWLYRLYKEPWRWRRQLSLFSFAWLTVVSLFKQP